MVFVEAGEKAPFPGYLFPPDNAENLASKVELCGAKHSLDAQFATDKAKLKLADEASKERETSRRELWEEPEDKESVKKLARALEFLILPHADPHRPVSGADAVCTEAV